MEINFGEKTWVMGILNVTPDSFSDGGSYTSVEKALDRAGKMIAEGADIIDVGGESTRPGHTQITVKEEIERVVPVISALSQKHDVLISIDTYKSEVADAAIEAGAHIINDVWGAKYDPEIAKVAAKRQVPIILMHNRNDTLYENFWDEVHQEIRESIQIALAGGVKREQIWLDPGIGFGKTTEQNIEMMKNLDKFAQLGYPVLLGTSRKSLIGKVLEVPVEERLAGSLATVCYGVQKGCHIVRVHDVLETSQAMKMIDVLLGKSTYKGAE